MVSISDRLREEREKSGLNQTEFGVVGGVTKKTQGLYEKGERSPTADYLAALYEKGVDVSYIVTGNQSVTSGVSAKDQEFLSHLHMLPTEVQNNMIVLCSSMNKALGTAQPAKPAPEQGQLQYVIEQVETILEDEQMQLFPEAKARVVTACLESLQREGEITASQIGTAIRAVK